MNPFACLTDPAVELMKTTTGEFEKILSKGAVGAPITVGDYTLIPLLITTFGVGSGGGSYLGEPIGGGGGGGVIPCAVLVVGPDGVELKTLPHEATDAAHRSVAALVAEATSRFKRPAAVVPVTPEPAVPVVVTPTAV
ncbi:hypothetical protein HL658_11825 [Azospirillum sp. RWY-5-1]|uniref:Sporulation protein YtfJ n=1 Tax=Azospirillum oleiclasticum TaxID=2735135 RepID=A0ABX2T6X8_9PROT|nr:spore germination protein GerW family protein [Azospirillum oleiclasticum]NYZ13243.1 hypothetical protein [Azospirillum oleiclasticum]NYZ20085.1 hypothetical protein [Azospirillum oleiclasticum]